MPLLVGIDKGTNTTCLWCLEPGVLSKVITLSITYWTMPKYHLSVGSDLFHELWNWASRNQYIWCSAYFTLQCKVWYKSVTICMNQYKYTYELHMSYVLSECHILQYIGHNIINLGKKPPYNLMSTVNYFKENNMYRRLASWCAASG